MQKFTLRDQELSEKIKQEFKVYPELLGQLLFSRGIKTMEEAERFLNPDYSRDIHDPFLMKDMEKSVERILKAIESGEKILIYSDYDADGIPGAVVFKDFFKKIGYPNFENYIPHRHNEGYGLNFDAIKKFKKDGVDLIITIDCGTKDFYEIEEAQKNGIDVIITDHHIVGEKIPNAFSILNPKQEDCNYPDDGIAGAGVIFKLVQALLQRGNFEIKEGWEKWLLDMVGLATISDMVPLKNENRAFSYFGMKVLRKSPRYGLIHLLRKLRMDQRNLTEDDLAFMITPRINVASRIDDPIKAFELLSSDDEVVAGELANYLDKINSKRKTLVTTMVRQANKKLKERKEGDVIVLGSPEWNVGVVGLVASSLVGKHQKTSFVWGQDGKGNIKGSCRSCGSVDVVELMNKVGEDIFTNIGGHKMAGGFSVSNDQVHFLEEKLNEAYQHIEKGEKSDSLMVDKKITLDDINWGNYQLIEKLAPFGMGNEKPVFMIEGVEVFNVKVFGKQNNHLGLDFKNTKGQNISSIQFFAENIEDGETKIQRGDKINILVNLEKSTFRNVNELRLRIVDFV
ncbi:single-stranded-DNA-specific exonuclease RecJ [Patescibacteria group bacterium]|nr:single-stranded-DNA-specific exonuclease RecJ [Patescibacteria group bacterium]